MDVDSHSPTACGSSVRILLAVGVIACSLGCRGHQYGHLLNHTDEDMVGSHAAGAAVYHPLIDEAVAKLLARQAVTVHPVGHSESPVVPVKRICFVGVENKSIEELGDFKDQIYQQIDAKIVESSGFDAVSRRYVQEALRVSRLRPDSLFIPDNMRTFTAVLEQHGQPVDYLLYATVTSGTTQNNHSKQRDYTLTLELVDVHSGSYDKQNATIRKGYHKTAAGKWWHFGL